ncbi:acyltransferase [Paenibacillus jamilae]|nr:acyltransferase [Paenibacillus jamilae]
MKQKIQTLQSWRFFSFLGIFLLHVNIWAPTQSSTAAFGVSFFIVLSGFLLSLHYYDKVEEIPLKIRNCLSFAKQKISKIYLLHIITFIIAVILSIDSLQMTSSLNILDFIKRAIVNIFLVQTWIPDPKYYYSFNAVSWYLSLSAFLYFMTIPLLKVIRKYMESKTIRIASIASIVIFQLLYSMFIAKHAENIGYFTYIFPIFRVFDFFAGCILGSIFLEIRLDNKSKYNKVRCTIFEALSIVAVFIGIILNPIVPLSMKNSVCWLPITLIVIFIFSFEYGFISKAISNKFIIHLGNISAELFLIHQLVINFMIKTGSFSFLPTYLLPFVAFIISIAVSELFHKFLNLIRPSRYKSKGQHI